MPEKKSKEGTPLVQDTLVLVKPDGVKRGLIGEIIGRLEDRGLKIVGMKMIKTHSDFAEDHYEEHKKKDFFPYLINYITSGPVIAMVVRGVRAVEVVRKIVGHTSPKKAQPGTIRGDYAHISIDYANKREVASKNLIHASGSKLEAEKEIELWFDEDEIHEYRRAGEKEVIP